jgi:lipoic acid synthetase
MIETENVDKLQNIDTAQEKPLRMPQWLKRPVAFTGDKEAVERRLLQNGLHTVCTEAKCPNRCECFSRGTATFLVMGDTCTRNCGFCNIHHGTPAPLDTGEPERLCDMVKITGIKHVVITSVTRDDLPDGGAEHFKRTVELLKRTLPECTVEILVPDFNGNKQALETVLKSRPDVFNHNIETVQRLYNSVRPKASYGRSLDILACASRFGNGIRVKSGIMAGLGETFEEMLKVLSDLRKAGCEILTIGQYLRPSRVNIPVMEYVPPEIFRRYEEAGLEMGFSFIAAGPYVRSSYKALEAFEHVNIKQ